jgi:sterol 14-demethylase
MGLIQDLGGPLVEAFARLGLASQIGVAIGGFLFLSVFLNVLKQVLVRNPNEPPLVFHWFPFVGSTITYGMDPPRFFKENKEKVSTTRQSKNFPSTAALNRLTQPF